MKSAKALAAADLAVGFGIISFIMLGIEPGMGFTTPGDFLDPVKVTRGYASIPWLVSTVIYLTFPVALYVLARSIQRRSISELGLAAAALGLFLACLDAVGIQLRFLLPGEEQVRLAVTALLPIRFAVLKATVVMLGLFAWGTTRTGAGHGPGMRSWRILGWAVLLVSVAFVFVFVPVPVAFFLWAAGLTLKCALEKGDASGSARVSEDAERRSQPVG